MCGFCNVWVCVCVGLVICGCMCGFCNVWMCGFCNVWIYVCMGVLVICELEFTVLLCCFVYIYLFLFVTSVRTTATE